MIWLDSKHIDIPNYKLCLQQVAHPPFYYNPSVLNVLCKNWGAFVQPKSNGYQWVFPLSYKKIAGWFYLNNPFFIQKFEVFGDISTDDLFELQNQIALKFIKIKANLAYQFNLQNFHLHQVQSRSNCVLNLNSDYTTLYANFSQNHKRNIQAAGDLQIKSTNNPSKIITLFKTSEVGKLSNYSAKDYLRLHHLITHPLCANFFEVLEVYNSKKECIAGGIFAHFNHKITFIFSGNSPQGYQEKALFFLLNQSIQKYANSNNILDFEGSDKESLQRFYQGFGAQKQSYYLHQAKKYKWVI